MQHLHPSLTFYPLCWTPHSRFAVRFQHQKYRDHWYRLQCTKDSASSHETTTENGHESETKRSDPFGLDEMIEEVKDTQELGTRGEGWLLAIVLSCFLVTFPPVNLFGLLAAAGWIIASTGLIFFCFSMVSLRRNNFPLPYPRKNSELIQKGIYAYIRHPMYSGILLMCTGLAAITRNETRGALCFVLWALMERLVQFEEKALRNRFHDYETYMKQTWKFLPGLY